MLPCGVSRHVPDRYPESTDRGRDVAEPLDYLGVVGDIEGRLRALGLEPVLVGGMALVILGSRRVTRDFDFVITQPADSLAALVDILYDRGLELVSRVDADGDVVATISNRRVAVARLRIDAPDTAYFFNPATELRIDLLFDFPIAASTLAAQATRHEDWRTITRRRLRTGPAAVEKDRQGGAV